MCVLLAHETSAVQPWPCMLNMLQDWADKHAHKAATSKEPGTQFWSCERLIARRPCMSCEQAANLGLILVGSFDERNWLAKSRANAAFVHAFARVCQRSLGFTQDQAQSDA